MSIKTTGQEHKLCNTELLLCQNDLDWFSCEHYQSLIDTLNTSALVFFSIVLLCTLLDSMQ